MGRVKSNKNTIKRSITDGMKAQGTYRTEYDQLIDVYAGLLVQYIAQVKKIEDGNFAKRDPLMLSVENLRRDILAYATRLGITPAKLQKVNSNGKRPGAKNGGLSRALIDLAQ